MTVQADQSCLQRRLLAAVLERQLYGEPAGPTPVFRNENVAAATRSSTAATAAAKPNSSTEEMQAAVEDRLLHLDPFITESLQQGILVIEDLLVLLPEHRTINSYKQILIKHMEATSRDVCTSTPDPCVLWP